MQPLRVAIADDDLLIRTGIEALLEIEESVTVVASVGDLPSLEASIATERPDVVLTDIRMPPSLTNEGVDLAQRMRNSHPDTGVVVLSQFVDSSLALSLVEDGARRRGYLLKKNVADSERMIEAIQTVASGGSFIDSDVIDALVDARSHRPGVGLDQLSPRETEVLAVMATGRTNGAIADQLFIGERAVEKHISNIFAKLELRDEDGAHRRVTAVLMYLQGKARASTIE